MTKQAPKKKFNSNARPKKGVVHYEDAPTELRIEMEHAMDAIDRNPDSFDAIISFGSSATARLGKIANNMIKVQGKFNDEVRNVADSLSQLERGLNGLDLDKFGDATLRLLKGLANGDAGNPSKAEDDKLVAEMQKSLPQMLADLVKLTDKLEGADKGLKKVLKSAQKLGTEREDASREINMFIGTAKEVLRRYNEEYIPQAKQLYAESLDPDDELYLKNVEKRKDDFVDRVTVLEGTRLAAIIAAQQLRQMTETMEDQRTKIRDILDNGQNEWKAMLSAAGIAGASLQSAQGRHNGSAPAPSAVRPHKSKKPQGPKHH